MSRSLEKIYVVFKTHFDIGFTGWVSDVVQRYRTEMLKDVIDICEKTKDNPGAEKYVWTMSAWPLLQSLEGAGEEDKAKALEFLASRQLIWHKLPYTTHTEFCGLEEWIRGMYVSRKLSEQFGYEPKDAKMTDVPGHTWIVPSLLKKAGVNILHLGCNPASTPPDVPPAFYWEGPDGERLLTFYSKGSYGTGILPPGDWNHPVWLAMIQTSDNHGPHDASVIAEMKASIQAAGLNAELHIGSLGDFADDFLARNPELPVIRGDMADAWIHGVGTAPREVARVRGLRGRIAAAESALAHRAFAGAGEEIAAAKGKIAESYEHTLLFGEHTWGMDCKTFLFPRTYDKESFRKDKQSERYKRMEHSWQEQREYLDKAEAALQEAVRLIAERGAAEPFGGQGDDGIAGSSPVGHGSPVDDDSSVKMLQVYNYLGWPRDGLVWLDEEQLPKEGERLIDTAAGGQVRLIPCDGGAYAFVKELPALGFRTLAYERNPAGSSPGAEPGDAPEAASGVTPSAAPGTVPDAVLELAASAADVSSAVLKEVVSAGAGPSVVGRLTEAEAVLENRHLLIQIDRRTGWVRSFFDKRLNKEWIDGAAEYGFGQFEYNVYSSSEITRYLKKYAYRFYDWGVHDFGKTGYPEDQKRLSYTTQLSDIRIVQDGYSVRVECIAGTEAESVGEYGNAREVRWSYSLSEEPYLDMELNLAGKEETPKAESGHLLFPLKLERPQYRVNKLGTVLDPCTDLVPSSSTLLNCCESFVDVSNGFAGMAIIPLDTPLFFIGRNGMWDFEPDYKPEKPEINFNLFNNWWGTNFPQWQGGDFRFRYRLVPHEGDWMQGGVWKTAQETMAPPMALQVHRPAAGGVKEMLPLGLDGMAVVAFKPAEDGDGVILRLRECIGEKRRVAIHLPREVREVVQTDLLERNSGALEVRANAERSCTVVCLHTRPFEVHTLRIR
ncbi:DUF5054 domain-containing protein [Paenibacillus hamazuiensis]|uniref:DUF5054 domain-containing protein n=1 Tax=Paenibacillus hamazuiensis TaxID=2936508 RepID=UPI00200D36BA|nr:DUF5054 domain-containing protein [Paenibacillus hamazuiensis]